MQHYSAFNKRISNPIQGFGYIAEGKLAMMRLQNEILQHVRVIALLFSIMFSVSLTIINT